MLGTTRGTQAWLCRALPVYACVNPPQVNFMGITGLWDTLQYISLGTTRKIGKQVGQPIIISNEAGF